MANFRFSARSAEGRTITGTLQAPSPDDAIGQLRGRNMVVLSLQEEKGNVGKKTPSKAAAARARVKSEEMVVFTRQMATMVSAGIPVLEALEILCEQTQNPGFQAILSQCVESVRSGMDLSESMAQHPRAFPKIFVNMVKAGEASGQLDEILNRLAEHTHATAQLKREIKGAMTYPVMSLCMILGITIFLVVFIIPKFQPIFDALGGVDQLPTPTRILLATSLFLQSQFHWIVLGSILAIVGIVAYFRTEGGRLVLDKLMLAMPIFGPLFQKVAISRFARTFSTLIESGVPILGALEIVASTIGNRVLEDAVNRAKESIRHGETLAKPLGETKIFPPMVVKMISIGERSGALEMLLKKVSEFYDEQVRATVDGLTSMIEPLLIGVMGFLVGGIVLAVFLPIFKLQKQMASGG